MVNLDIFGRFTMFLAQKVFKEHYVLAIFTICHFWPFLQFAIFLEHSVFASGTAMSLTVLVTVYTSEVSQLNKIVINDHSDTNCDAHNEMHIMWHRWGGDTVDTDVTQLT